MAEKKEDKGFKVIDRRGQEESSPPPPATPPAQPPGPAAPEEGNLPPGAGVQGEKGRAGKGPSSLGAPRFLDLVHSLQMGAMVGLGMIQGPGGKRPPVDLPGAKDAIDLLGILQEKTKGNLTKEEEDVLREGLYHLRMGYMALMNAPPAGHEKGGNQR
jgi:hypothetical protein